MAYEPDMPAAAHRHLDAGNKLIDPKNGRRDVAGYLFGLAAECAVKAMASRIPETRREDVLYAHFPTLRTLVRDALKGRRSSPLRSLMAHDSFMTEWEIDVRYARGSDVTTKKVEDWQAQAKRAVVLMDG